MLKLSNINLTTDDCFCFTNAEVENYVYTLVQYAFDCDMVPEQDFIDAINDILTRLCEHMHDRYEKIAMLKPIDNYLKREKKIRFRILLYEKGFSNLS